MSLSLLPEDAIMPAAGGEGVFTFMLITIQIGVAAILVPPTPTASGRYDYKDHFSYIILYLSAVNSLQVI